MFSRLYQGTLYQVLYGTSQSEGVRRHALETDPNALIQKAQKLESGGGGLFSKFTDKITNQSAERLTNAADLYIQAANAFRLSKQEEQAGKAFVHAAELQTRAGEQNDAANTYQEAFKMYRQIDPQRAVDYLNIAINTYALAGNTRRAATQLQSVGEIYETEYFEGLDKTAARLKAIEAYEKAADWFETDRASALANKLRLKIAELAASIGQIKGSGPNYEYDGYIIASEIFQKVAKDSVSNNLMKWSVKDYLLKGGICRLAHDTVGMDSKLEEYRNLDPTFDSTMEHQLLVDLTEAVKHNDVDEFTGKLFEYDQKSKLDNWKSGILRHIKDRLDAEVDDFS